MFTGTRLIVLSILLLIGLVTAWSKLRFVEEEDHQSQRWRVDEYPGFQRQEGAGR